MHLSIYLQIENNEWNTFILHKIDVTKDINSLIYIHELKQSNKHVHEILFFKDSYLEP